MSLKYSVHIVAPAQYAQIKSAIEHAGEVNGEPVSLVVSGWDYSFSTLAHWAGTQKDVEPDIVLMFDVAEYPKLDEKTGCVLHYAGMINCIKETRLKVDAKYVFILSSDMEENLEFLNELMKINIHNFYFAPKEFTIEDLKKWMFVPERSLKDNEKYLLAGNGLSRTKVIREKEIINRREAKESRKLKDEGNEKDPELPQQVREKVVTVEKVIRETVPVSFKKLVLCVLGYSEFACELAYVAARLTNYRILIADLDFIAPKSDIYLNLHTPMEPPQQRGLLSIFEVLKQDMADIDAFENACVKHMDAANLFVLQDFSDIAIANDDKLPCSNGMDRPDESKSIDVAAFIESAYRNFDITILILDKCIHDPVISVCMKRSDYNLWVVHANMDSLRECGAYMEYYCSEKNIPLRKNLLVAYEYKKNISYPVKYLNDIFYPDCLLGIVSYHEEREYYRNLNQCYAKHLVEEDSGEYVRILSKFNIVPVKSITERFGDLLRNLVNKSRLLRQQRQKNSQHPIDQTHEMEETTHEQKDCV